MAESSFRLTDDRWDLPGRPRKLVQVRVQSSDVPSEFSGLVYEATVNTAATTGEVQWTETPGGAAMEWVTAPLALPIRLQVTDSPGSVFGAYIAGKESNVLANAGLSAHWYRVGLDGVWNEIGGGPNESSEFSSSLFVTRWSEFTGTSNLSFVPGERIGLRLFICAIGTMAAGYTVTMRYGGATSESSAIVPGAPTFVGDPLIRSGPPCPPRPRYSVQRQLPLSVTNGLVYRHSGDAAQENITSDSGTTRPSGFPYFGDGPFHGQSATWSELSPTVTRPYSLACWIYVRSGHYAGEPTKSANHIPIALNNLVASGTSFARIQRSGGTGATLAFTEPNTGGSPSTVVMPGWHHVVAVAVSSTNRSLWVDGQLRTTSSSSSADVTYERVSILCRFTCSASAFDPLTASDYFGADASLDHRLYNRALTEPEIKQLYADGQAVFAPKPRIVVPTSYAAREPVPVRAAPAIHTKRYSVQRHLPLSVTNGLVSCYPGDQPGELYGRGGVIPVVPVALAAARTTASGLVVHKGSTNHDMSVDVPLTLAAWGYVNPAVDSDGASVSVNGIGQFYTNLLLFIGVKTASLSAYYHISGVGQQQAELTVPVTAGWHHVVGVCNSSTSRSLWVDGKLAVSDTTTVTAVTYTRIGVREYWSSFGTDWNVRIGTPEVTSLDHRVYNRALTEPEIKQLYADGQAIFAPKMRIVVPAAYPGMSKRQVRE